MIKLDECINIYREAFGWDEHFDTKLFYEFSDNIQTIEVSGKTVCMIFLLPCKLCSEREQQDAFYLYAAATRNDARSKGYMTALIEKAKQECDIIFLKPASKTLEEYYSRLGFKSIQGFAADGKPFFIKVSATHSDLAGMCGQAQEKYTLMCYSAYDNLPEEISFSEIME